MTASQDLEVSAPVSAMADRANGVEVGECLKFGTSSSGCQSCYFFINHHRPNALPALLAVRSNSHCASAA
jgi:hypothetical protein